MGQVELKDISKEGLLMMVENSFENQNKTENIGCVNITPRLI